MSLSLGSGITNQGDQTPVRGGLFNAPEKYTTVEALLSANAPDVREELVKAYGE